MRKIASMSQIILSVAALAAMCVQATAAEPPKADAPAANPPAATGPAPAAPAPVKPGFQCHDKSLTGSGPGFKDSQDESEEAAKQDWLGKAKAVYSDAGLIDAKDVSWECVKQGLYIKCFLSAVPCHPKPAEHGNASP
jgi:ABC-type transport system substrate-binding protein